MITTCQKWSRVIVDVLLFIIVGILVMVSFYVLRIFKHGFFCDDQSIQKPFVGDTVGGTALVLFCIILPAVLTFIIEILHSRSVSPDSFILRGVCSWLRVMGLFMYGWLAVTALTEVGKQTVGRLRPHFIDTCKPDVDLRDCLTKGFIMDYNCTNTNASASQLMDIHMSFPSGHSSSAAFTAIFLCLICQLRIPGKLSSMFGFVLQGIFVGLALFCGLSRVQDNRHHPTDVLTGFVIGTIIPIWMMYTTGWKIMEEKEKPKSPKEGELCNMEAVPQADDP